MMTAPASRSFFTTYASSGGMDPASSCEPAVVGRSNVSKLSLSRIGTPWIGDLGPFVLRSLSSARACSSAFGFSVMTALMLGPCLS